MDFAQSVCDIPIFEYADHMELARAVHRILDFRFLREFFKGEVDVIGPNLKPANMPAVINHHGFLVCRVIRAASRLMLQQGLLYIRWEF